jgi:hypothetical protein
MTGDSDTPNGESCEGVSIILGVHELRLAAFMFAMPIAAHCKWGRPLGLRNITLAVDDAGECMAVVDFAEAETEGECPDTTMTDGGT